MSTITGKKAFCLHIEYDRIWFIRTCNCLCPIGKEPQKEFEMKTVSRLILSAIFLALTGIMVILAMYVPEFVFSIYPEFSRKILSVLSSVTGTMPFALWQIMAVLLVLWILYTLIQAIKKRNMLICWFTGILLTACILLFSFVLIWGLGHYGPTLSQTLDLKVEKYSTQQLHHATLFYMAKANETASLAPRGIDNLVDASSIDSLSNMGNEAYDNLAEEFPFFDGPDGRVKTLLAAPLFSYGGITGIFIPFTGESAVNPDTYGASLGFTVCHEIGHRMGITGENDANFAGFLACMASPEGELLYSGYYSAFVYTYNALYKADKALAALVWEQCSDALQGDMIGANAHYDPYEGAVQEATQKVNDAYLKAFQNEDGIASYGAVADQLIAFYLQIT